VTIDSGAAPWQRIKWVIGAQIFGLIPANNLGAHDSDWEHVTVRLTPDAKHVIGIYYSAHRRVHPGASPVTVGVKPQFEQLLTAQHILHCSERLAVDQSCSTHVQALVTVMTIVCRHVDGVWRSADEVPRTADGRPISYVALHGHGSYLVTGRIIRLFGAFNDHTSARGATISYPFYNAGHTDVLILWASVCGWPSLR